MLYELKEETLNTWESIEYVRLSLLSLLLYVFLLVMRNIYLKFLGLSKCKLYRFYALFILIAIFPCNVVAQSALSYNAEINGSVSTGNFSPFWLSANKHGVSSIKNGWGYMRMEVTDERVFKKKWNLEYGTDIIIGRSLIYNIFIQQIYADVSWRWLRISVGKKERTGELKNHSLSTGGLIESGNAAPIPQVRIEMPRYCDFPGTKGWLGLRGHIAYGWFDDGRWQHDWVAEGTRYAKNVLYHSKSLFWKIGKEQYFPLSYEGGVQFASQFGGTIYNYMNKNGVNYKMPTRLKDFWNIFIYSSGDGKYDLGDRLSVAGNHLGSYHLSLKWNRKYWSLRGYYEHMFEDHSGMFWEYGLWKDCLAGVELQIKGLEWINNIVFEYFNSRDQAGPIYHDATGEIPDQISAVDDYFDHHAYPCWQQYGASIGTPLITSCLYNKNHRFIVYNNRVEAFHIGVSGQPTKEFAYRTLLTKSRNWGTYKKPFTEIMSNISALFEIFYTPRWSDGFSGSLSLAFDKGELYGDNKGIMFAIKKNGKF